VSDVIIDERQIKDLLKQALSEVLQERKDLLEEVFAEVIEDIGLAKAINDGAASESVTKEEILKAL